MKFGLFRISPFLLIFLGSCWQPAARDVSLVAIPSGDWVIGSDQSEFLRNDDEFPPTSIDIERGFQITAYEITRFQYKQCVDDGRCEHPQGLYRVDPLTFEPVYKKLELDSDRTRNWPVTYVTWHDANKFAVYYGETTGLNCRLPTEVEWEVSARAGTRSPFHFGAKAMFRNANFDPGTNGCYPVGPPDCALDPRDNQRDHKPSMDAVGLYKSNQWGLYDVHGNAAEWTSTCYTQQPDVVVAQSPSSNCKHYSVKGGSLMSAARDGRSSARRGIRADATLLGIGFRVVCRETD